MLKRLRLLSLFLTGAIHAQYTDQINSNRPGVSIGAFAVGKGIVQFEGGFEFRKNKHQGYNNSTLNGSIGFLSARWGFLSERFELLSRSFMFDKLTNKTSSQDLFTKEKDCFRTF